MSKAVMQSNSRLKTTAKLVSILLIIALGALSTTIVLAITSYTSWIGVWVALIASAALTVIRLALQISIIMDAELAKREESTFNMWG